MTTSALSSSSIGWKADLELVFESKNNGTALVRTQHHGPLLVQKPFYPEGAHCCHAYIIHPPGGIVGGDSLNMNTEIRSNAHALLTTPAATKFYRSNCQNAFQNQTFNLDENAILEWLPQETVYFNGAYAETKTRINATPNSRFIAWEIQCLGRPAVQEDFSQGSSTQKFEVWLDKKPVMLECNRLKGGASILSAAWGLRGHKALGTMIVSNGCQSDIINSIKNDIKASCSITMGLTSFNGLLIIRAMSRYAEGVRELFTEIWELLRPTVLGREASAPRIWQT